MRTSWIRVVGGLSLLAIGMSSVSAGVRARPERYRGAEVRVAQGTREEVIQPKQANDSLPAPRDAVLPPSAGPQPIHGGLHFDHPVPPPPRDHLPLHPPRHDFVPPVRRGIHHEHIVQESSGSGSQPCCGSAPALAPTSCGCSISTPAPLCVQQPMPVAPCGCSNSCSNCSGGGHHFRANGFSQVGSIGNWDYSMNFGYNGIGYNVPATVTVGALHPSYSSAFPNGYYRSGAEAGMYHFPYYSYRRPWYYPGQPSFHRDTDIVW